MTRLLLIRVDGDAYIGTGHVMRCLALAQAWQNAGGETRFVMARYTPALQARLTAENMTVSYLNTQPGSLDDAKQLIARAQEWKADWVALDGYNFGMDYQTAVSQVGLPLLVIDDLGGTAGYRADIIVNQNIYATPDLYSDYLPATHLLMGCDYALLRCEFWPWRSWRREIPPVAHKIVVTLGGSDPNNVTRWVVQGLLQVTAVPYEAIVVVGGSNPHMESLETAVVGSSIRLQKNITNMPELMAWADVAIAAGGSTNWELAFMGLPALVVILADNQERIANRLDEAGIAVNLGGDDELTAEKIGIEIGRLLQNSAQRQQMSQKGQQLVDGYGAERVVQAMMGGTLLRARPATSEDTTQLFQWVNDPLTRQMSFHNRPIPWENHVQWLKEVLVDSTRVLLIVEKWESRGWMAVGQVRFDGDGTVSIGLAPDRRGQRLALPVLQTAVAYYRIYHSQKPLTAYIKPENIPSYKIFTQAGFSLVGETEVAGNSCLQLVLD